MFTAIAPATRVTGSMLTSRMCPLEAMRRSICSRCSSFERPASGLLTVTEYGSGIPPRNVATPPSSNSIGRFLKHTCLAPFVGGQRFLFAARQLALHGGVLLERELVALAPRLARALRTVV